MAVISIPKEMIKKADHKKNAGQSQTIEACNKEIKSASRRAERVAVTSIKKLKEEMRLW